MKTIAIGTMKGGTGKTTLTFNMGAALAHQHKVLFWDIDPQCNLSNAVGMDIADRNIYTTRDIFENPKIDPEKVRVVTNQGFHVIPGSIDLTVTEAFLPSRAARELILTHYIEDNRDFFEDYDYILFDTNPSMSNVNKNGFVAADSIVLVSDVSGDALRGAELFMFLWSEIQEAMRLPDKIKAMVLNNCDYRINLTAQLVEYCESQDHLSQVLIPEPVPARVVFKRSLIERCPVCDWRPVSDAGDAPQAIDRLIENLRKKGVL